MAELKSTHPDVKAAQQALWDYAAEAVCFVELTKTDDAPAATLGAAIITRLTDAIDRHYTELLRHGMQPLEDDGQ